MSSMSRQKSQANLENRLRDLASRAFHQSVYTFTDFLSIPDQDVFWHLEPELRYAGYVMEGGHAHPDRMIIRFGRGDELGYTVPFPISCLHIEPLNRKFADSLSHRDFLGALMNLGIDRSTIGDIKVGDREAYLFCQETIAEYICRNLEQIRHTSVNCYIAEEYMELPEEAPEEKVIQVSSCRVDSLIAKVYNMSRGDCLELFRTGKVFVDGRGCENNSRLLKGGETINARGYGKFTFSGDTKETRKGKLAVTVSVYR